MATYNLEYLRYHLWVLHGFTPLIALSFIFFSLGFLNFLNSSNMINFRDNYSTWSFGQKNN